MKNLLRTLIPAIILLGASSSSSIAQTDQEKLSELILRKNAEFWKAYNTCDTASFKDFITGDVEFYHDKGGVTLGLDALVESMKRNICGGSIPRLRREAVAGTEVVFPLRSGNEIYGAILSGEHVFYILESDGSEHLDGRARFTHLWLKKDGEFKMTRILSYDHGPAVREHQATGIQLSPQQLDRCVGTFLAPKSGRASVTRESDHLVVATDKGSLPAFPESETVYFVKGRDLVFEFQIKAGKVSKMIVHENGAVVEEAPAEH